MYTPLKAKQSVGLLSHSVQASLLDVQLPRGTRHRIKRQTFIFLTNVDKDCKQVMLEIPLRGIVFHKLFN